MLVTKLLHIPGASKLFQNRMFGIFVYIPQVETYFDDLTIYGYDEITHVTFKHAIAVYVKNTLKSISKNVMDHIISSEKNQTQSKNRVVAYRNSSLLTFHPKCITNLSTNTNNSIMKNRKYKKILTLYPEPCI